MNKFLTEMFKYYQEHGVQLSLHSNYYNKRSVIAKRDINDTNMLEPLSLIDFENFCIRNNIKNIPVLNEKKFNLQFFSYFYLISNSNEQKKLLLEYGTYSGHNFNDTYKEFLSYINIENDKLHKFFKNIHIETSSLKSFNLTDFNSFLLGCKISKQQRNDIIFDFIKIRRKEIKNPSLAPIVRDFLIEENDEAELKRYFPFFPFLHAHFKDRKIDCFDNIAKLSTSIVFTSSKMVDSFCVDGHKSENYLAKMKILSQVLKLHYGFKHESIQPIAGAKHINTYLHNNPEFTQNKLTNIIVAFFTFIKENLYNKEFNGESIEHINSWLSKYELELQLYEKTANMKTLKI